MKQTETTKQNEPRIIGAFAIKNKSGATFAGEVINGKYWSWNIPNACFGTIGITGEVPDDYMIGIHEYFKEPMSWVTQLKKKTWFTGPVSEEFIDLISTILQTNIYNLKEVKETTTDAP